MDKHRLAAKFKRVSEWKEYLNGTNPSEQTKITLLRLLPQYETLLKKIWEEVETTAEDTATIATLERQLEDADEQARLFTAGR